MYRDKRHGHPLANRFQAGIYSFSNRLVVHEEFGPAFAWMGNLAALKAKLQELGYDAYGDMIVGAVIVPEVIVRLTAADMHVGYDSALLVVQFEGSSVCGSGFTIMYCFE